MNLCLFLVLHVLSSSAYHVIKPSSCPTDRFKTPINSSTRKQFLVTASTTFLVETKKSNAFEGGVGGLGKSKPKTGVVFANPDLSYSTLQTTPGDYNAELLAPDENTTVFLSFYAPWPMLKSQGIESRDLSNPEASFVQVAPVPINGNLINREFFIETIFGQSGKFGAYGVPSDIKVSKIPSTSSLDKNYLYQATFTTLTPSMRESDRKVFISTKVIGGGVFMLVTGTTSYRFRNQEKLLRKVADSFDCIEAPKSKFRR